MRFISIASLSFDARVTVKTDTLSEEHLKNISIFSALLLTFSVLENVSSGAVPSVSHPQRLSGAETGWDSRASLRNHPMSEAEEEEAVRARRPTFSHWTDNS